MPSNAQQSYDNSVILPVFGVKGYNLQQSIFNTTDTFMKVS